MSETRVVNMRRRGNGEDVTYVGRPTRWGNPYHIGTGGTREEVIEKYEQHILASPKLLAALPTLRGKTLGCWCAPPGGFKGRLMCHAQILAGLADGVPPESTG